MDDGSEVFNPTRYSEKDGHISALQKLLEIRATVGESAWASEYQMNPVQLQAAIQITPEVVASRKSDLKELEIPDENVQWVCASSDLNLAKYITTTIVVFMNDQTSVVIYHKFRKCAIPFNIPEQDYYQRVYNLLSQHGQELKSLGIRIDAWAIDANGQPYNAVVDFVKRSRAICGIPAAAFIGKASHQYRSFMRTRLKEDVNRTLLCGNEDEHKVAGSGRKYTFFDSDLYHSKVQLGFLQALGNVGSISWYNGIDHSKWAVQVCAEKLIGKKAKGDGTTVYTWKEISPDHDALDSIGQALAAYASMGFSTAGREQTIRRRTKPTQKRKLRII